MEYLFQAWKDFTSQLEASTHVLLLSDYDGTLTPIVSRPEVAVLSPSVKEKLHILSQKPSYSIGIISGRSLEDLKKMVAIEGIYYAGNHGMEIEGPTLKYISDPARAAQSLIKELAENIFSSLADVSGVIVEDKGLGLSVHYRLVSPEDEFIVADVFRQFTHHLVDEGKIKVTSGKKVYEVRPPIDWHKGKAVETIITKIKSIINQRNVLTIYMGDDTTDEDAFRVLNLPGDWSIYVGGDNPLSAAEYYLDSTTEVDELLSRLIEMK